MCRKMKVRKVVLEVVSSLAVAAVVGASALCVIGYFLCCIPPMR